MSEREKWSSKAAGCVCAGAVAAPAPFPDKSVSTNPARGAAAMHARAHVAPVRLATNE